MNIKMKRPLGILLVVCLVVSLIAGSAYAVNQHFEDAKGHWAEEAIQTLVEKGVIHGFPDGLVHPDEIITRAEFAALVARTLELPEPDEGDIPFLFSDLSGHWAEGDVETLVVAGIIQKGDFGDYFLPDQPITRMEMIRMLVRAIGKGDFTAIASDGFTDTDGLSDADQACICAGKKYGIVEGYPDGTVQPSGNATRAEAFEMLVDTEKAKEQIKQEDRDRTEDQSSDSGGGSAYAPAPQFAFSLPESVYMGEEISILPESKYVSGVTWTGLKNDLPAPLSDVLEGELTAKGGIIRFKDTGSFTLTATAKNSRGRTATCEQTLSVYPVITATFTLPETAHTDTSVPVELIAEHLGANQVVWSLTRDGKAVTLPDAMDGELDQSGGTVLFREKGAHTLTASITDECGKTVIASSSVTVFPVAEVKLTLTAITHTDKTVKLSTETKEANVLTVAYTLTRNGEVVEITDFIEGEPADGSIRFKEKGVYSLTTSITDPTGRVFTDTANITVYPLGSAGFYLPEIFHTDHTITVEATFGEIGSRTAMWSLTRDGETMPLTVAAEGTLNNNGGQLRFKEKGSYTLKAEFTDDGGRSYHYEQGFTVYPVPAISYSLPEHAHTDSDISVQTETTDLEGLKVGWLVDNTYGFQDFATYVEGSLTNDGGTIRFKRAGIYELVARVTDATGRVFLFEPGDRCEVLPVLSIGFELPELAYTDTVIDLRSYGNNNVLPVEWTVTRDGKSIPLYEAFFGKLNAQGGKITFRAEGNYILTATMTDYLKRSYSHSQSIHILPVVQYGFDLPQTVHYGTELEVVIRDAQNLGSYDVVWSLEKDGEAADYDGTLDRDGGRIAIRDTGTFVLTASITDSAGRVASHSETITVTNNAPDAPTLIAEPTRDTKDGKFLVNFSASATDPDGDEITLEWDGTTADSYYAVGNHTVKVRAKDIAGAYSPWTEKSFTVTNTAPVVTLSVEPTRTIQGDKFLVNISAEASDADGDETTLEWENREPDGYYSVGTHTVSVRARDAAGLYSEWASKTFSIENSTPSTPVIHRSPGGNSVAPGTPVTITASSSDPDGDAITLVWEGRNAETQTYPLGKNVVRVKAVDSTGAESPWAAIVFFVADATNGGGMTLTGPESVILENGLEGATITEYTFTVPPVSGHSGSDYGRVRGYNILTGQWDQLDYGTTNNGITFQRTLGSGVYSKLEFYYYTNHNCMYNKSNITYSVTYHFE